MEDFMRKPAIQQETTGASPVGGSSRILQVGGPPLSQAQQPQQQSYYGQSLPPRQQMPQMRQPRQMPQPQSRQQYQQQPQQQPQQQQRPQYGGFGPRYQQYGRSQQRPQPYPMMSGGDRYMQGRQEPPRFQNQMRGPGMEMNNGMNRSPMMNGPVDRPFPRQPMPSNYGPYMGVSGTADRPWSNQDLYEGTEQSFTPGPQRGFLRGY